MINRSLSDFFQAFWWSCWPWSSSPKGVTRRWRPGGREFMEDREIDWRINYLDAYFLCRTLNEPFDRLFLKSPLKRLLSLEAFFTSFLLTYFWRLFHKELVITLTLSMFESVSWQLSTRKKVHWYLIFSVKIHFEHMINLSSHSLRQCFHCLFCI